VKCPTHGNRFCHVRSLGRGSPRGLGRASVRVRRHHRNGLLLAKVRGTVEFKHQGNFRLALTRKGRRVILRGGHAFLRIRVFVNRTRRFTFSAALTRDTAGHFRGGRYLRPHR
jgi:hypothetical protein